MTGGKKEVCEHERDEDGICSKCGSLFPDITEKFYSKKIEYGKIAELYFKDDSKPYIIAAHPKVLKNLKKSKWWKLFKKP